MTPRSFDSVTAREMLGDILARTIEAKARKDADAGKDAFAPPKGPITGNFLADARIDFERAIYLHQFKKRLERNERKATA